MPEILAASCHVGDITEHTTEVAKATGAVAICWTEAYSNLNMVSHISGYEFLHNVSKTDKRRGASDIPVSLSHKAKLLFHYYKKMCGASSPRKIAPERWLRIVGFEYMGKKYVILHTHTHAAIQSGNMRIPRIVKARVHFFKLRRQIKKYIKLGFEVTVTGDLNMHATGHQPKWGPVAIFNEFHMRFVENKLTWVATTAKHLSVRYIGTDINGQDHSWIDSNIE